MLSEALLFESYLVCHSLPRFERPPCSVGYVKQSHLIAQKLGYELAPFKVNGEISRSRLLGSNEE